MNKIIIDDTVQDVTPEIVAEVFAELDSEKQALFFNRVAEIASKWSWGGMGMQLQYVTDEDGLSLGGRRVMSEIGDYSHWGLCNGKLLMGKSSNETR